MAAVRSSLGISVPSARSPLKAHLFLDSVALVRLGLKRIFPWSRYGWSEHLRHMETTPLPSHEALRVKRLDLMLWFMQGFLFLAFGALGLMKLTLNMDALARFLTWPTTVPEWLVRGIGAAELAGACGVFLPALMRMQPWVTQYAAMGLVTIMICALGYHMMLFQGAMMLPTIVLGVVAGYVAWGRQHVVPVKH
jgi:DoxX-like family